MSDFNTINTLEREATPRRNRQHHLASGSKTLLPSETGMTCTNKGASAEVTYHLPGAPRTGVYYTFVVRAAQELRVNPDDAHQILINGGAQTAGSYITADDEAESITVEYVGDGEWIAYSETGTWTVEP